MASYLIVSRDFRLRRLESELKSRLNKISTIDNHGRRWDSLRSKGDRQERRSA